MDINHKQGLVDKSIVEILQSNKREHHISDIKAIRRKRFT